MGGEQPPSPGGPQLALQLGSQCPEDDNFRGCSSLSGGATECQDLLNPDWGLTGGPEPPTQPGGTFLWFGLVCLCLATLSSPRLGRNPASGACAPGASPSCTAWHRSLGSSGQATLYGEEAPPGICSQHQAKSDTLAWFFFFQFIFNCQDYSTNHCKIKFTPLGHVQSEAEVPGALRVGATSISQILFLYFCVNVPCPPASPL